MTKKKRTYKASPEDIGFVEESTRRSVSERLAAGEVEIVEGDDWRDIPELPQEAAEQRELRVPERLYRKLKAASRQRRTTPDRLAAKWLSERLEPPARKA